MNADLAALRRAVNTLLKARRAAKRAAKELARASSGFGPHNWDRLPLYEELSRSADYTINLLKEAEAEVLASWEALNYLSELSTSEPIP